MALLKVNHLTGLDRLGLVERHGLIQLLRDARLDPRSRAGRARATG
jgi:hypothetical protein